MPGPADPAPVCALSDEACAQLARRLAADEPKQREHLLRLLAREPGIVLERYGGRLTGAELDLFEPLRANFEVGGPVCAIGGPGCACGGQRWQRSLCAPQVRHYLDKLRPGSVAPATRKNRRYAKLQRLVREGAYFSDAAMRKRHPLLFHEYVGQHTAAAPPSRGQTLSESILQQHDELQAREALVQAQAAAPFEPETESDSEEGGLPSKQGPAPLSQAELQDSRSELIALLQSLFLAGKDPGADYADMDNCSSLDGENAEQQERDRQEDWFASD